MKIWFINRVDKPNFRVSLPHRRSTTVSLETNPLYWFSSGMITWDDDWCSFFPALKIIVLNVNLMYGLKKSWKTKFGSQQDLFFVGWRAKADPPTPTPVSPVLIFREQEVCYKNFLFPSLHLLPQTKIMVDFLVTMFQFCDPGWLVRVHPLCMLQYFLPQLLVEWW